MPYIYQKNSRRHFIKVLAGGAGAIAMMGVYPAFAKEKKSALKLALFSDTHIPEREETYRGFSMVENLKKVIPQVKKSDAATAIITGDLARLEGRRGDYVRLKTLLQPLAGDLPVAMTLGNHDRRDHFLDTFPEHPGERQEVKNKYVLVLDTPEVTLVLLDSLIFTNESPPMGFLGKTQRQWLARFLKKNTRKPVILFEHHTLEDNDGDLADAGRLFEIIRPHRQVKAIVFGHSHVYGYDVRDDIHLINLPAVGYNFRDEDPVGWVDAKLTADNGTFTLHAVAGNTQKDGNVKKLEWRKG